MWRNSTMLIAKECKKSLSPKCLRKNTKTDSPSVMHYSCLRHSNHLKLLDYKYIDTYVGQHLPFLKQCHRASSSKISKSYIERSVKDSDKKTIDEQSLSEGEGQDKDIEPVLKVVTNESVTSTSYSEMIPGKGPPPEPPIDCCMSGCVNCVWIQYAEELRDYYAADGNERAKIEIEKIENPSLRAFIKLELGLL